MIKEYMLGEVDRGGERKEKRGRDGLVGRMTKSGMMSMVGWVDDKK